MTRPRVLLAPHFRQLDEIFTPSDFERLDRRFDLLWARDEPIPVDVFRREVASADAIVFGEWPDPELRLDDASPRVVLEVAGGHHHRGLDYETALERGILIGSCAPAFADVVAEHALALTLASIRGVCAADHAMRSGTESWLHEGNVGNSSLFSSTLGFVGFGGIARRLRSLVEPFGCTVVAHDPFLSPDRIREVGAHVVGLRDLMARSDVIVVAAAPTDSNRALISRDMMGEMRPEALLVAISRAALIDFDAAVDLASAGKIRFATDVFPDEPINHDAAVRSAPNTVLTPHLAGALPSALHRIGAMVVDDLEAIFDDREPQAMQYLTTSMRDALVQSGS